MHGNVNVKLVTFKFVTKILTLERMKCKRAHTVAVLSYLNHIKEDQHNVL
jgi:hypothetical protein